MEMAHFEKIISIQREQQEKHTAEHDNRLQHDFYKCQ